MAKSPPPQPLVSALAQHPDILQAIGMISVELNALELSICTLFARILDVRLGVAHAIYFTPKAGQARLEVVENVAAIVWKDRKRDLKFLRGVTGRTRSVMNRRNAILHGLFGAGEFGVNSIVIKAGEVVTTPMTLEAFTDIVRDTQLINGKILAYFMPPFERPKRYALSEYKRADDQENGWRDPTGHLLCGRAGQSLEDLLDEVFSEEIRP